MDEDLQRAQNLLGWRIQRECFEHAEQLTLLVPKMALHNGRGTLEVTIQLGDRCGPIDRGPQYAEQVGNHRVVLGEVAEHRLQLGVSRLDRRKQEVVLALVVPIKGGAKPVAVQQQLTRGCLRGAAFGDRSASEVKRLAEAHVHLAKLTAPGDEPGRLALSHAKTKDATSTSSVSLGWAPPCLTRSATGTRRYSKANASRSADQRPAAAVVRPGTLGELR